MEPVTFGSKKFPLEDTRPIAIATAILNDVFSTPGKQRGLHEWSGAFWAWKEQNGFWAWVSMSKKDVEDCVWLWMSNAHCLVKVKSGDKEGTIMVPLKVTMHGVSEVVRCMEALCRLKIDRMPKFFGTAQGNPDMCIAFRDKVLDVGASAEKGEMVLFDRDEGFFESQVLPFNWGVEGEANAWVKALDEWGGNDEAFPILIEREMAYGLMAFREYAKWFFHYGEIRGGKGTIERVRKLLMGENHYFGVQMKTLASEFGLYPLAWKRVMVVSEVNKLEEKFTDQAGSLVKNVVGMDPIPLNRKFVDESQNVVSRAMVVMLGNLLPNLPNTGNGLSSKMVPVPFTVSFLGRENYGLSEQLAMELPQIGMRMARAAVELVREKDGKKKFPMTKDAEEMMEKYKVMANPADSFLQWGFRKLSDGFVASQPVYGRYEEFCQKFRLRPVNRNEFNIWLEAENSWGVRKKRQAKGGSNGFVGLTFKPTAGYDDE